MKEGTYKGKVPQAHESHTVALSLKLRTKHEQKANNSDLGEEYFR